jgi:hypothetical protein
MKYFLSTLACLILCQASFGQNNLSETAKAAQTKKDIEAYTTFQKKEDFYMQMKEYQEGRKTLKLKDYKKTMTLMKAAAAKGNPLAEYAIGGMYMQGFGVPKNEAAAIKWYTKSADNGNMYSLYVLSDIYYDSPKYDDTTLVDNPFKINRFNVIQRCANSGCEDCIGLLASTYKLGQRDTANYSQAVSWYKKIAEENYIYMESIAILYYEGGHGLLQSKKEALQWYLKAANAKMYREKPFPGSKYAMYELYQMYSEGDGIDTNQEEGFKWLLKMGEIREMQSRNEEDWMDKALYQLGNAYYTGTGVAQNYIEALKWFTRGAEIDRSPLAMLREKNPCMIKLAIMYREGQGVKKDLKIAEEWQRKAESSDLELD